MGISRPVHGDGSTLVISGAPDVRRVNDGRGRVVQLYHEYVPRSAIQERLERGESVAHRGQICGCGGASQIHISASVDGNAVCGFIAHASKVSGVDQHWIDHQRLARVVGSQGEPDFIPAQNIPRVYRSLRSSHSLVGIWL